MSFFGRGALKPTNPAVRTEVRSVSQSSLPHANGAAALSRAGPTSRPNGTPKGPPQDRFKLTPTARIGRPKDHTTGVRKTQKRKSASPAMRLSSESEGDSDVPAVRPQQKKQKTVDETRAGPKRQIRATQKEDEEGDGPSQLVQSRDLTVGEYAKLYAPMFVEDEDAEITLQYPNSIGTTRQEGFRLVRPVRPRADDHDPISDLVETMKVIARFYLPPEQSAPLLDPSTGVPFRLNRAVKNSDLASIRSLTTSFNDTLATHIQSGLISNHLDTLDTLHADLVKRILTQIYARAVSPKIESLSSYKAASDNVYGELQYDFCSAIFRETALTPTSTFLDLGSGVGNVVLQAALETGCESWGIETMPKACALAAAQATEFRARAALWGLNAGSVSLLDGDFFADPRLDPVLRRADVVLVNNQAFQPETNSRLVNKFLEMKDGARLVSLKNFASGYALKDSSQNNPVAVWEVRPRQFWDDWVSWTHKGGEWFVATKDVGRIERVLGSQRRRAARG